MLTGILSDLHFAPTESSKLNLIKENVNESKIFVTGNTVIDSLFYVINILKKDKLLHDEILDKFKFLNFNKKVVLITGHRRENFGKGFENICKAIDQLAKQHYDVQFVYPMHLNPSVRETVLKYLSNKKNIFLIEPLDYLPFIFLIMIYTSCLDW